MDIFGHFYILRFYILHFKSCATFVKARLAPGKKQKT